MGSPRSGDQSFQLSHEDCLLVNLSFTEQLSVSIFGIRGRFKTLNSVFFLKLRGPTVFIRPQIESQRLF